MESIIGSIRSVFSLHSIRSRRSPTDSTVYGKSQDHERLGSSVVGLTGQDPSTGVTTNLPDYEVHAESLPLETLGESAGVPKDHIGVKKDFRTEVEV